MVFEFLIVGDISSSYGLVQIMSISILKRWCSGEKCSIVPGEYYNDIEEDCTQYFTLCFQYGVKSRNLNLYYAVGIRDRERYDRRICQSHFTKNPELENRLQFSKYVS